MRYKIKYFYVMSIARFMTYKNYILVILYKNLFKNKYEEVYNFLNKVIKEKKLQL